MKKLSLLIIFASLLFILTACTTDKGDHSNSSGATELEGSVTIDGSGTVYPFMAKMAENYMVNEQPSVSVEVGRSGTSAGFKKFLVGENGTDFNDASRPIKEEEKETAKKLGIEVQELKIALDGLTFVIHAENDWAKELTKEELMEIFLASGNKKYWSDVRPEFPNEPIHALGPNENHGTYEFFWETILDEQDLREDIHLQQDYSVLVDLVSKDKNAIAFFGFGYYDSNKDKLQAVKVDFGNGPVEPTIETIGESDEHAYKEFTRPLFTYLNTKHAKEKPQVLDFAIYLMENAQKLAGETGFAPLNDEEVEKTLSILKGLK